MGPPPQRGARGEGGGRGRGGNVGGGGRGGGASGGRGVGGGGGPAGGGGGGSPPMIGDGVCNMGVSWVGGNGVGTQVDLGATGIHTFPCLHGI